MRTNCQDVAKCQLKPTVPSNAHVYLVLLLGQAALYCPGSPSLFSSRALVINISLSRTQASNKTAPPDPLFHTRPPSAHSCRADLSRPSTTSPIPATASRFRPRTPRMPRQQGKIPLTKDRSFPSNAFPYLLAIKRPPLPRTPTSPFSSQPITNNTFTPQQPPRPSTRLR